MKTLQESVEDVLLKFKNDVIRVQTDAISTLYCELLPYFEDDLISNMRIQMIQDLKYSELKHSRDFKDIRAKIFKEHRDEIVNDLNQDNILKIEELQKVIEELRYTK